MTDPARQWLRVCQVIVGKNGSGVSVSKPRIQFDISKTMLPTPNTAIVRMFNLSPQNEAKFKNEYDEILVNAGYLGSVKLIFRGNIKHVYRYRDGNDFITEIEAADGDKDFRQAIMSETFAAGTQPSQIIDRAVSSFSNVGGTTKGVIQVPQSAPLRGRVVCGNTRDVLHDIAGKANANWSIQDGVLHIISTNGVAPGTAININSDTGMLSSPEINDKGIAVKCLLNPLILPNGALKLDNNSIKAKRMRAQALGKAIEAEKAPVRLDPDGIYKTIKVNHKGDNRGSGSDWFSEITCIGIDQPIPQDGPAP